MAVIAKVSAAPTRPKRTDRGTEIASQLSAAIDVDERKVKQMLSALLRRQRRRADDGSPSQLVALEDLFLTLRSMALTDELTGLYNRRGFLRAGTCLLDALSRDRIGALLFYIDVDNLKVINDSAGHAAGDSLLTRTAHVLRAVFRGRDPIGRLGGDEFVVLVPTSDAQASKRIMDRMQAEVAVANLLHTESLLSLSAGFAQFDPRKPSSLPELLRQADMAMYGAKLVKLRHLDPTVRTTGLPIMESTGLSGASQLGTT
jgi:diguanylate cyclase (GGDEF)-like protein